MEPFRPDLREAARSSPPYRPFGGLRFLLAAMVLAQHGLLLLPEKGRGIFYWLELGAVAVTMFFALSGFVVAESIAQFYAGRPLRFLANRVMRIAPLYGLALCLTVALDCWFYARGHFVPLDGSLQGPPWRASVVLAGLLDIVPGLPAHRVSGQDFSFIPYAWTLRVECAFYLAACLACWIKPGRQTLSLASWLAYAVFGLFVWQHRLLPQQLLCVPFFAFGACLYSAERQRGARAVTNLLVLSACAELAFTFWDQRGHPELRFQLPLLGLLLAMLVWLGRHAAPHLERQDRLLGALSYPLYLGHGVVLGVLLNVTGQRGWPLYAAGMAGSLGLAVALNRAVELPMRGFRARIRGAVI